MCTTCGCSDDARAKLTNMETGDVVMIDEHSHHHHHEYNHSHDHHHHDDGHTHSHAHDHPHDHAHTHAGMHGTAISLETEILAKNDKLAERNRGWFEGRNILALNLVSSPGSGKTTLLERTIRDLSSEIPINVIEGDQETVNDAQRIKDTGCRVVQINTGTGCHLEADMLARGLKDLQPPLHSVVMIENVGNLEIFRLEKNLSTLASIAGAAPMIGFFGTVTGMIAAFQKMATEKNVAPDQLAEGIYQALITTAGGLFIGILAFVGYNVLVSNVEKVVYKMERTTVDFMDLLQEPTV